MPTEPLVSEVPLVVVDASVALRWFRPADTLADVAARLLDEHLDDRLSLCAPALLAYEVTNMLRLQADLEERGVRQAVQALYGLDLLLVPPSDSLLRASVSLSLRHGITVFDAAYVALAQELEAELVTANERLAERLEALSFVCSLQSWSQL